MIGDQKASLTALCWKNRSRRRNLSPLFLSFSMPARQPRPISVRPPQLAASAYGCKAIPTAQADARRVANRGAIRRAACPIARGTPALDLWSKGRRFEMTETLARPVVPAAEERARLKEGVHIERASRRVRTYFGGKLIADSEHVLLVYESRRPPAYWFPIADVRMEYLEQSEQDSSGTLRWRLAVDDHVAENVARAYAIPADDRMALNDHLTFFWDRMDSWFEED